MSKFERCLTCRTWPNKRRYWHVVDGIRVKIPLAGFEGVGAFVYEYETDLWRCVLEGCGLAIGAGASRRGALANAVENIRKLGLTETLARIAKAEKKAPKKPKVQP